MSNWDLEERRELLAEVPWKIVHESIGVDGLGIEDADEARRELGLDEDDGVVRVTAEEDLSDRVRWVSLDEVLETTRRVARELRADLRSHMDSRHPAFGWCGTMSGDYDGEMAADSMAQIARDLERAPDHWARLAE